LAIELEHTAKVGCVLEDPRKEVESHRDVGVLPTQRAHPQRQRGFEVGAGRGQAAELVFDVGEIAEDWGIRPVLREALENRQSGELVSARLHEPLLRLKREP